MNKTTLKYFLYFLLFVGITLFIYLTYKYFKKNSSEGFQAYKIYKLRNYVRNEFYDAYELVSGNPYNEVFIQPLGTWNLSLPPEFETQKLSWDSGFSIHTYIGTIDTIQQSTIKAAENFYKDWSYVASKNDYIDNYLIYNQNRIRLTTNWSGFERALNPTANVWVPVTVQDIRRLNPNAADVLIRFMYEWHLMSIKDAERDSFQEAIRQNGGLDYNSQSKMQGAADRLGDIIRGRGFDYQLFLNKERNNNLITYQILSTENSDAAREYLETKQEVQDYLEQVGVYVEQTVLGELAGPVLGAVMNAAGSLPGAVRGVLRQGKGFLAAGGRNLIFNLRRGTQLKLIAAARRLKLASNLIKQGKMAGNVIKTLGTAVRGVKTAIFASPVGIVMALADAILSLIPDSVWRSWGETQATDQINKQVLKCPHGYMDGNKLSDDEFNTVLDMIPIPSGFGVMDKSKQKKLSCVAFDADGQADIQVKRQCAWPASDYKPNDTKYWYNADRMLFGQALGMNSSPSERKNWHNNETCFMDPPPPISLYPPEPTIPPLYNIAETLSNVVGTTLNTTTNQYELSLANDLAAAQFFSPPFANVDVTNLFQRSGNWALRGTLNYMNDIYLQIREQVFISSIRSYNALPSTNLLSTVAVGLESNFDFYYQNQMGINGGALSSFTNVSYADKMSNAFFARNFTYVSTLTSELTNILMNDIFSFRAAISTASTQLPMIFTNDDNMKSLIPNVVERPEHTLLLTDYRSKLGAFIVTKTADQIRYSTLLEEYNANMSTIKGQLGNLDIANADVLNRLAQYLYDETFRISGGKTATIIDKMISANITCDNMVTLICNISCVSRDKQTDKTKPAIPWRNPNPSNSGLQKVMEGVNPQTYKESDKYYFETEVAKSRDNNVPIEFYLNRVNNVWTPTAWGRPNPTGDKKSMIYNYIIRSVNLDYTPTIVYKNTTYFNVNCADPTTLRTQLNYYKEENPLKNIQSITGWKKRDNFNCVMQWTETDYNPNENTEGPVRTQQAVFNYQNPDTPYPYQANGQPLMDVYQGYITLNTPEPGMTTVNLPQPKRGLPPEATLAGGCGKRCFDPDVMKAIMDTYNKSKDPEGGDSKIINIKKIFTSKDNRCDFIANVNTGKGLVVEQRRSALLTKSTPTSCAYVVTKINPPESGTFVSATEGFINSSTKENFQDLNVTPYPGYYYQSTTVNSQTVPRYNFGNNILGSVVNTIGGVIGALTNSGITARQKTYAALGADATLEGCPNIKCSSDDIMKAMATKYNSDNFNLSRMNRILKVSTASPTECDVYFEDINISGSNRVVNFWRDGFSGRYASDRREITAMDDVSKLATTYYPSNSGFVNMSTVYYSMRFNMRKIPDTCKFEAVSYKFMNPFASASNAEDTSTPLFTANSQVRERSFVPNLSSVVGCGGVNCLDTNTLVQMVNFYRQQNPTLVPTSLSRAYNISRDTCVVEFALNNTIKDVNPAVTTNTLVKVFDSYRFKFATPNSNTCFWTLVSGEFDSNDSIRVTKGIALGGRYTNYVPGESSYMQNLRIPRGSANVNLTNISFTSPTCANTIPIICMNSNTLKSVRDFYFINTQGQQLTNISASYTLNSNKCEYKVQTTAGTSFEQTHLTFNFQPTSNCSGWFVSGFSNTPKANSYTEGWMRPERSGCYPIKCESDTVKTMVRNYYKGLPGAFQTGEDNLIIDKVARVNSNTCEYEVHPYNNSYYQILGGNYEPRAHKSVTFKSVGLECDTMIIGASNVANKADSLTIKIPFSCPNFDPMSVFTNITSSNDVYYAIRAAYPNSIFNEPNINSTTNDRIAGPEVKSIDIIRGKVLPQSPNTTNMRIEYDLRFNMYLYSPNSSNAANKLALAKLGTLVKADANQPDYSMYRNSRGVPTPPEYRTTGTYTFAQSNFTQWQPSMHIVLDIAFPWSDCSRPALKSADGKFIGFSYVQSKANSVFSSF